MSRCWDWDDDPGPCPVDDTPHTACCSPDYLRRQGGAAGVLVVAPAVRPGALIPRGERAAVITTKTYRRNPPLPGNDGKTRKPERR